MNVTSLSENKVLIGRSKAYEKRIIPSTYLVLGQNLSPLSSIHYLSPFPSMLFTITLTLLFV